MKAQATEPKEQARIEDIWTVEQLAKALGLEVKVIKGWKDKGMPHIRIDRKRTLIHAPSFAAWLMSKVVTEGSASEGA